VRRATSTDAGGIARVRRLSWSEAYSHIFTQEQLDSISEDEDAGRWRRFLTEVPARTAAFVAARGDRVVGFSSVGVARPGDDPTRGELFTIYVLPEEWGAGIGRALMDAALQRMRDEGFAEAILWVLEDNSRTRRFYELAGWHVDGVDKEEEWLGAVVRELRYHIDLR
jgi:GNAT superfamily N-acetyltransferase